MVMKEAERERMRHLAKVGWALIAAGFIIVGAVFLAAYGFGLAEGSGAFSALVVVGYGGCLIAVVGTALIIMFHLYDRSFPPAQ
jgi:hypothetical protein